MDLNDEVFDVKKPLISFVSQKERFTHCLSQDELEQLEVTERAETGKF
ncbi:hypothetical protein KDV94_05115 [Providencia rettgeri]